MSVGQLTQRNSYNLYGNFFPNQSGTIEDEGELVFQNPGLNPPTYATRRYYYSIVGNCVSFQALIELQDKGNGTGFLKWRLPDAFPQASIVPGEPNQVLNFTIDETVDAIKYLSYIVYLDTGKELSLFGRQSADGILVNIGDGDIDNDTLIWISGSYFTL